MPGLHQNIPHLPECEFLAHQCEEERHKRTGCTGFRGRIEAHIDAAENDKDQNGDRNDLLDQIPLQHRFLLDLTIQRSGFRHKMGETICHDGYQTTETGGQKHTGSDTRNEQVTHGFLGYQRKHNQKNRGRNQHSEYR